MAHLEYTPRSNPQNQIKSVASSASDRNSNQFQSPLILWFKCNKKKQLPILIILIMFMSKTEDLIIIMLISILLIPVYTSTYSSHASFSIIIKSTTTHFFYFFPYRSEGYGELYFFPCPFPPPSPIASNPPFCFACHCPLCAYYFFNVLLLFFIGIASGNLYRGESIKNPQSFTIWCYKKHYKQTLKALLKTITYYFMHKLKPYVTCTIIIVSFAHFFPA